MKDVLMAVVVLGLPTAVILAPILLRSWERRRILDAVIASSTSGQVAPPELVEALIQASAGARQTPLPRADRDARRGALLLGGAAIFPAAGLAALGISIASGAGEGYAVGAAIAALGLIPGSLGVTYLLLARSGRRRESHEIVQA